MATSLHPPPCDVCFCQSVSFIHTQTETEKAHIHIHSTAQRSPAVNHGSVRGRKQTGYSVPWHKSLKLWPGCCRESTVCHTLQIQASLCHTQITSLSISCVSLYFFLQQTQRSHLHAGTYAQHPFMLIAQKKSGKPCLS